MIGGYFASFLVINFGFSLLWLSCGFNLYYCDTLSIVFTTKIILVVVQTASQHVRYSTFNLVYQKRWKDILRFRDRNLFSQCEICQTLKSDLSDKALNFDQKLGALQMYRAHLHDQFCDRTICLRLQAESAYPSTDLVTICTDGLDQAKFALPRDPLLRSSAALTLDFDMSLFFDYATWFYWIV